MLIDIPSKNILIFGCGNILFGDDGFGAAVVKHLQENYAMTEVTTIWWPVIE